MLSLCCDAVALELPMFQHADEDFPRASFTPFAARTQQYVKEQLGQADDKVSLRA
jgi:hypothetical protein